MAAILSSISSISKPRSAFSFSNLSMSHHRQAQTLRFSNLSMSHHRQTQTLRSRTMCVGGLKLQQQQQHNKLKLLFVHEQEGSPKLSLLSTEEEDNSVITISSGHGVGYPHDSCHGLVLSGDCYIYPERLDLWNWNLSTKELIKTLPPPPTEVLESVIYGMYGLGFDSKESDYKVLRFIVFAKSASVVESVVELYSLKTDTWKPIAYPHSKFYPDLYNISINGFNYWLADTMDRGEDEDFVIIRFDFANNTFHSALIPGPVKIAYPRISCFLVEFEGSLAVIIRLDPPEHKESVVEYGLWVWDANNESWSDPPNNKEPVVEYELWVWNANNESWSRRGEWAISGDYYPLGLFKNHQLYLRNDVGGELVLFDCVKQKLKKLGLYGIGNDDVRLLPYIDSSSANEIK